MAERSAYTCPPGVRDHLRRWFAAQPRDKGFGNARLPIAYGEGADLAVLQRMAEATDAKAYDAGDPATIDEVFTAVVSNF